MYIQEDPRVPSLDGVVEGLGDDRKPAGIISAWSAWSAALWGRGGRCIQIVLNGGLSF